MNCGGYESCDSSPGERAWGYGVWGTTKKNKKISKSKCVHQEAR
jgi:hypothetical protein